MVRALPRTGLERLWRAKIERRKLAPFAARVDLVTPDETPQPRACIEKAPLARQFMGVEKADQRLGLNPPYAPLRNAIAGAFFEHLAVAAERFGKDGVSQIDGAGLCDRQDVVEIQSLGRFPDQPARFNVVPEGGGVIEGAPVSVEETAQVARPLIINALAHEADGAR